jgi:hypothetical protein
MTETQRTLEIDRKLFIPLADFFLSDNKPLEELLNLITILGPPPGRLVNFQSSLGFISEAYVKWVLSRFQRHVSYFKPSEKTEGEFDSGRKVYSLDKWGNMVFRRKQGATLTEIDGLYEFRNAQATTPVIIEVKQIAKSARYKLKSRFVGLLYQQEPYFCKLRFPEESERTGLFFSEENSFYRRIVFNRKDELKDLAFQLAG